MKSIVTRYASCIGMSYVRKVDPVIPAAVVFLNILNLTFNFIILSSMFDVKTKKFGLAKYISMVYGIVDPY